MSVFSACIGLVSNLSLFYPFVLSYCLAWVDDAQGISYTLKSLRWYLPNPTSMSAPVPQNCMNSLILIVNMNVKGNHKILGKHKWYHRTLTGHPLYCLNYPSCWLLLSTALGVFNF